MEFVKAEADSFTTKPKVQQISQIYSTQQLAAPMIGQKIMQQYPSPTIDSNKASGVIIHSTTQQNHQLPHTFQLPQVIPIPQVIKLQYLPRPDGLTFNNLINGNELNQFIQSFSDKENYFCQVCSDILWEPRACSNCNKLFCSQCLVNMLQTSNNCQGCNCPFIIKNVDSTILKNLSKLILNCNNKNNGCNQNVYYDLYYKHLQECEYSQAKCKNPQCKFTCLKKDMSQHEEKCEYQEQVCTYCKQIILKLEQDEHTEKCNYRPIQCPNAGCNMQIPKIHLSEHDQVCTFKVITCEQCSQEFNNQNFKKHKLECEYQLMTCEGCKKSIIKKDFQTHLDQCEDIYVRCDDCGTSFKRADTKLHTDVACLKESIKYLKMCNKSKDIEIQQCKQQNLYLTNQFDKFKHKFVNLCQLVHDNSNCQCSQIGEPGCIINKIKDI